MAAVVALLDSAVVLASGNIGLEQGLFEGASVLAETQTKTGEMERPWTGCVPLLANWVLVAIAASALEIAVLSKHVIQVAVLQ